MTELGLIRGLIVLITLLTFVGICWWAYRPANRSRFEEDGLLVFAEDEVEAMTTAPGSVDREKA
jgi:cytochrome c oxidase cbb3-type subunit 4